MLGFGFNKTKVLASAERNVQQGKLQNAITDYEKIAKEDPKDITVLNTIGDLYARLGQVDSAVTYFKKVGDYYATEGFTVKAIAMYKKLTKLNPTAIESVQKLADLYTQQGLYNDARQQFMVVADNYIRANSHDEAARVFQKMLELDPENASLQSKLADLYIKLGKKEDARNIYLRAAEALYQRGTKDAASESLNRVLNLDPGNVRALQLKAQLAFDRGDAAQAANSFEKIPDIDSRPEALNSLLKAYIQLGKIDEAAPCAKKLLSVHHDIGGMKLYAEALLEAGKVTEAIGVYQEFADQLIAANGPAVVQALDTYISKVKDDPKALEDLNTLFQKAGDTSHDAEIKELLAHACVQQGDLTRARDLYKQLAEIEPENPLHHQNYKQIQARLGEDSMVRELSQDEGSQALMVEELEGQEILVEQHYPDLVASAIQAALTESDLFESYNVPQKALAPLESVLPQAPQDVRLNQRLAAIYARLGRSADAAQRCAVLQTVFSVSGLHEEAIKYGEMAAKYAQAAGTAVPVVEAFTPEQISPASPTAEPPAFSIAPETTTGKVEEYYFDGPRVEEEQAAPAPVEVSPTAAETEPAAHAHEIDLSDEWESMMTVEASAAEPVAESEPASIPKMMVEAIPTIIEPEESAADIAPAPEVQPEPVELPVEPAAIEEPAVAEPKPDTTVSDTVEEVRFYISQTMWSEAAAAVDKLAAIAPQHPEVEHFQKQILAAMVAETREPEPAPPAPKPEVASVEVAAPTQGSVAEFSFEPTPEPLATQDTQVPELPSSPDEEVEPLLVEAEEPEVLPFAPVAAQAPPEPEPVASNGDVLADFVSDLENSLGDDFLGSKKPLPMPPPAPMPAMPSVAAVAPQPIVAAPAAASIPTPMMAAQPSIAASAPAVATAPAQVEIDLDDGGTSMLQDLFEEFKEDMEEGSGQTEDPDTHYNLGMAFKEMGLLDEAIGELQKVCQAIDRGQPFSQSMQAFTWLANCFVDKGVPEASFKWFQKALTAAQDEDTRTAIHYEMACAYEIAGMKPEALRHFMEVYSANIDYRDVAERIKQLKS